MWNQRAQILCLSKGDGNTKYFHTRASHRFKKNIIMGIHNSTNVWTETMEDISVALTDLYQDLFTTSNSSLSTLVLDQVPQVITEDMNSQLIGEFSTWKVAAALKQMDPLKALRLDGMPPLFFQHFWPIVEGDITPSVLSWLNIGILPHPLNHIYIALIPKKKNPEFVTNYCPISLCNVLYKICFLKSWQTD